MRITLVRNNNNWNHCAISYSIKLYIDNQLTCTSRMRMYMYTQTYTS